MRETSRVQDKQLAGNNKWYSDGLNDGKYISYADAKRHLWFGSNPVSRLIEIGDRVMLTNKTVFRVTHVNNFEYNGRYTGAYGLIKALVLQTTLLNEDDLKENAAWNEKSYTDVQDPDEIFGQSIINLGETATYSIQTDVENVELKLDNPYEFVTFKSEGKKCEITATSNFRFYGNSIMILAINKDTYKILTERYNYETCVNAGAIGKDLKDWRSKLRIQNSKISD